MKVNTNIQSLRASTQLKTTEKKINSVSEKLTSGSKINHASDNPTGYAMSSKLDIQIKGLNKASENIVDGKSVTSIVDGVLGEMSDIIQRLNELAVEGGTDSLTDEDRANINDETNQLLEELTSMTKTTQFNNQNLLDGSFEYKGYTNNKNISIKYYSDSVDKGVYNIDFTNILSVNGDNLEVNLDKVNEVFPNVTSASFSDNELTLKGNNNFELTFSFKNLPTDVNDIASSVNSIGNMETNIAKFGAMTIQVGANQGQTLDMRIPNTSLSYLGLDKIDLSTKDGAIASFDKISSALSYINNARSNIGAYANRLDYQASNVSSEIENLTSSYSKINDTDIADAMSEDSNLQVLQEANISVLKQINDNSTIALQLLQ